MKLGLLDADFLLFYVTQGNKVLDENGEPLKESGKFVYTPKEFSQVCADADNFIEQILIKTESTHYLGFLGNGKNFRYDVFPQYKANRTQPKPEHFRELKNYLAEKWKFNLVEGIEADDAVVILKNSLKDCFLISPDKDILKCIEGTHFNPRVNEWVETSFRAANYNFWCSMIAGDSTDGIKGIPGKGIKYAETLLGDAEFYPDKVLTAYIDLFPTGHQGIKEFYKNYSLLKILDEPEYSFNPTDYQPIEFKPEKLF